MVTRLLLVPLLLALLITSAVVTPASAQVNFVGYLNPLFDEDFLERVPGLDVGDYAGLPNTAAARKQADTWKAPEDLLTRFVTSSHFRLENGCHSQESATVQA